MCVPPGVQESVWGCGGAGEGILGGERASERAWGERGTHSTGGRGQPTPESTTQRVRLR